MKRSIFILFLAVFCSTFKAQQPSNLTPGSWQNALLRADGVTILDGVEAYCTKMTCGSDDYAIIRYVNTNAYQVAVEWIDGIFVNGNWFYAQSPTPKKLYLPANSTTDGSCNGEIKLKVLISSLTNDPGTKHFSVSGLKVTQ